MIARYAGSLTHVVSEDSVDERLIGRALLRLLIENCDETLAKLGPREACRNGVGRGRHVRSRMGGRAKGPDSARTLG
jgi:hypothetical protein